MRSERWGALTLVAVMVAVVSAGPAPSPPLGIPADWVEAWKQGDLLFGTAEPAETYRQVSSLPSSLPSSFFFASFFLVGVTGSYSASCLFVYLFIELEFIKKEFNSSIV